MLETFESFKALYNYAKNFDEFEYNEETNSISWWNRDMTPFVSSAKLTITNIIFNDTITNWENILLDEEDA